MPSARIFVGPTEIAGMYAQLVDGLNEIGLEAELVERNPHPFGYPSTRRVRSRLVDACRSLNKTSQTRSKNRHRPEVTFLFKVSAFLIWLIWTPVAMTRYSSFIFAFGHSLWPFNLDLPLLRLFKKTTIMHLGHGSEARPPYLGGEIHLDAWTREGARKLARRSRKVRRTVQRSEKHASIVIGHPFSNHYFATKPFVNSLHIGIPQKVTKLTQPKLAPSERQKKFRVLHSPSTPQMKGTPEIVSVFEELKSEGLDVELVLLSGVPNDLVRKTIGEVDLVVDQLYADGPMPGLATEASAQAKAAIVSGYGLQQLKSFLPSNFAGITENCLPHELKETVREMLISGKYLGHGIRAQNFVLENLSPANVARRIALILQGTIPTCWWVDPFAISYYHGACQPESVSKRQIRGMVSTLGSCSLELKHKPQLLDALTLWSLETQDK